MDHYTTLPGTHAVDVEMNVPMPDSQRTMKPSMPETPASRALRSAVNSVLGGTDAAAVAASHGLPLSVLNMAVASYRESGWGALSSRVQRPGSAARRKLTHAQEQELHAAIRSNMPDELGLQDRLWTREDVRSLVQERTGIVLPPRTLSAYLERWGFAPEKPMQALHRSLPAITRAWMKRDYPIVAVQAREAGAQLYWWGDVPLVARERNRLHPQEHAQPLWSPGSLRLQYMTTNRGHICWMVHEGELDIAGLLEFLSRSKGQAGASIHLLVQDHPLFASPLFIDWSLRNKHWIELLLVPIVTTSAPDHSLNGRDTQRS